MLAAAQTQSPKSPWLTAYAVLKHRRLLDRVIRHFEWRLLHRGVHCGAATVHQCPASTTCELQAAVCCPEPACLAAVAINAGWMERVCRIWLTSRMSSYTAPL